MEFDYTSVLIAVISAVVSIVTAVPITTKFAKRRAEAESFQVVQDVYRETIIDLRTEREAQKQEILSLRVKIDELREKIEKLEHENRNLKRR